MSVDPEAVLSVLCPACVVAEHPLEHRPCAGGNCTCRCRLPKPVPEEPEVASPRTDLDHVGIGWWVNWKSEADREPRGGVVVEVKMHLDLGTGEVRRSFRTAKLWGGVRWDSIPEWHVGEPLPPDRKTVRDLWRALARDIGQQIGVEHPMEHEMCEAIAALARSVA